MRVPRPVNRVSKDAVPAVPGVAPHMGQTVEPEQPSGTAAAVHFLTTPSFELLTAYSVLTVTFMMIFLQSDVLYNAFVANEVARGHLNVYAYFSSAPHLKFLNAVMPPLYYLTTAAYLKILMVLGLDPVTTHARHVYLVLFHVRSGLPFSFAMLLLKLPNLVAMIGGLFLCRKLAAEEGSDGSLTMLLWAASPALIVTSLMQAQNDIMAAVVTLAALVLYRSKGPAWLLLLIGLAACFKTYGLILIPVSALLVCNRNPVSAIKYALLGFTPFVLVSLPFLGHAYIDQLFLAHDSGSLFGPDYAGRMPTHLWPILYVGILVVAWVVSKRPMGVIDVAGLWFLSLAPIFVVGWWVPQWLVWLLPAVIVYASRDRLFAWLWLAVNAAVLANDLFNFPGNMDGGMLMPLFGDHDHPYYKHVYVYHLYLLSGTVPYAIRDGVYMVIGIGFLALSVRVIQSRFSGRQMLDAEKPLRSISSINLAALIGPILLLPYIATMVVQRLAG